MSKQKKLFLILVWVAVVPVFVTSLMSLLGTSITFAAEEVAATAADTSDIEDDISSVQNKLKKEQKAKEKLQQNLGQIQQAVSYTQQDINKTKNVIVQTEENISKKQNNIEMLNDNITLQIEALRGVIREVYYGKQQPLTGIVLSGQEFSDALSGVDQLTYLQERIRIIVDDINTSKDQIQIEKEQLAEEKVKHEELLGAKIDKKEDLVADQVDTQRSIADKQKSIDRLNKELNQLQGDLNTLLGKSYSAKNIMDAVDFASDKTGVPKGFLIGVLKMETNLGANVGGCTYGQVEEGAKASYKAGKLGKTAWNTFLNRRTTFKGITNELDLDYQKQKVSCNPKGYTGTGGAMGVAQFMPDTWNAYKAQVASITGNNPPSPWNLGDGVMAMALKLGRVPGVTEGKKSAMKSAACSYLGTCYAPYINGILYWADNYKDLIN